MFTMFGPRPKVCFWSQVWHPKLHGSCVAPRVIVCPGLMLCCKTRLSLQSSVELILQVCSGFRWGLCAGQSSLSWKLTHVFLYEPCFMLWCEVTFPQSRESGIFPAALEGISITSVECCVITIEDGICIMSVKTRWVQDNNVWKRSLEGCCCLFEEIHGSLLDELRSQASCFSPFKLILLKSNL